MTFEDAGKTLARLMAARQARVPRVDRGVPVRASGNDWARRGRTGSASARGNKRCLRHCRPQSRRTPRKGWSKGYSSQPRSRASKSERDHDAAAVESGSAQRLDHRRLRLRAPLRRDGPTQTARADRGEARRRDRRGGRRSRGGFLRRLLRLHYHASEAKPGVAAEAPQRYFSPPERRSLYVATAPPIPMIMEARSAVAR